MPWLSELDVRQIDDKYFRLLNPLIFVSEKYKVKITAPIDLISDGPSVGRWPLLFLLFGKKGKKAAVIHDWLYRCTFFTRAICDDIYFEALKDSGYVWTARGMYSGVRLGGWPHYAPPNKAGCLDPREKCIISYKCIPCNSHLSSYKLTVAPILED